MCRRACALVKLRGGSKSNAFTVQKVHKMAMDRAKGIARRLREEREAELKVRSASRSQIALSWGRTHVPPPR